MRSDLRLEDLGKSKRVDAKLMNVKIPTELSDKIDRVARELGCSKTALIIALFNEGLDAAAEQLRGMKKPKAPVVPAGKRCSVSGCERQRTAKGLCQNHYQAARRRK